MKFSGREVPESLFQLARNAMRARASFVPEDIRKVLVEEGKPAMLALCGIEKNHWIIANRVMRAVVHELAAAGEIQPLKRGVWMKASIIETAQAQEALAKA